MKDRAVVVPRPTTREDVPTARSLLPPASARSLELEADRVASRAVASHAVASPESSSRPADLSVDLAAIRPDLERRLGHDFGSVRVHAGEQAGAAVRSRGALAYTVGSEIHLDPASIPNAAGRRHVLAHELTHVAQQAEGRAPRAPQLQPRPRPAAVDQDAQRIIDLAAASDRPIAERGPAVVRAIVDQYFAGDASKIQSISYREDEPGLHVTYRGTGAQAVGLVTVGRYFVEHTTQVDFARRVSQVRHEIEHVEQERSGMTGANRSDEREFIAFYHEALSTAPTGAGRMQHSTRVNLLDAALGYYCCLSAELQRSNATRRDELLARRTEEVRRSGHSDLGDPPTACRRQGD